MQLLSIKVNVEDQQDGIVSKKKKKKKPSCPILTTRVQPHEPTVEGKNWECTPESCTLTSTFTAMACTCKYKHIQCKLTKFKVNVRKGRKRRHSKTHIKSQIEVWCSVTQYQPLLTRRYTFLDSYQRILNALIIKK